MNMASNVTHLKRENFGTADVFSKLLRDRLFTDAKVASKKEPNLAISCHRVVLSAVSEPLQRKFVQNPRPETVILLDFMDQPTLVDIIKLIYNGEVAIKNDKLEDFLAALRSLNIRLGDDIDKMVFGNLGRESQTSTKMFSMKSGTVSYRNVKKDPEELSANRTDSNQFDSMEGHPSNPLKKLAQSSRASFPANKPLSLQPQPLSSWESSSSVSNASNPGIGTHFKSSFPVFATNSNMKDPRPPKRPGLDLGREDSKKLLKTEGFPEGNQSVDAGQSQMQPKPGPLNYFWLRVVNQTDTTEHAVKDKYGSWSVRRVVGSFERDKTLFLAFESEQDAFNALSTVRRFERDTDICPTKFVPQNLLAPPGNSMNEPIKPSLGRFGEKWPELVVLNMPEYFVRFDVISLLKRVFISSYEKETIVQNEHKEWIVGFKSQEDALKAKELLDNFNYLGKRIRCFLR